MVKFIVASYWLFFLLHHNQSDTFTVFDNLQLFFLKKMTSKKTDETDGLPNQLGLSNPTDSTNQMVLAKQAEDMTKQLESKPGEDSLHQLVLSNQGEDLPHHVALSKPEEDSTNQLLSSNPADDSPHQVALLNPEEDPTHELASSNQAEDLQYLKVH